MATKANEKPKAGRVIPETETGELEVRHLREHPDNPRRTFHPAEVEEMAASMRPPGRVDVRLIVRPVGPAPEYAPGEGWRGVEYFEVLDGHKRLRAAKLAGLKAVPVDVVVRTDEEAYLLMLRAFAQRSDPPASEQVAAYGKLAAGGKTADQIADATGKPIAYVRSVLRLAKLPGWALAAVDAGVLPRAVAEIVARVPGAESREKAAACVLLGVGRPSGLPDDYETAALKVVAGGPGDHPECLSYREARHLVRDAFTRQLATAPFGRKSLDLLPAAGSCDACPNRAGNNDEARADGIRADCCLDPDCYRAKEDAYRVAEAAKLGAKGIPAADLDTEGWDRPPRGWCRLDAPANETELAPEFTGYNGTALGKLLGDHCPARHYGFARHGKAVLLVKTGEARKGLVAAGVLKERPKERKREPVASGRDEPTAERATAGKPKGPADWEVTEKAALIGVKVIGESAAEQVSALDELEGAGDNRVLAGLRLAARAVAYEWLICGNALSIDALRAGLPDLKGGSVNRKADADLIAGIARWPASRCLAFLLQLSAAVELEHGPNTDTARDLLDFAELDWDQLKDQARRGECGRED